MSVFQHTSVSGVLDFCSESQAKGSVHVYMVKKLFMVSDVAMSLDYVRCDLIPITLDENLVLQCEDRGLVS